MTEYDSPWKEALDQYFERFLAFFFPEAHVAIDWSRRYESLDKELQQIVSDSELGLRLAGRRPMRQFLLVREIAWPLRCAASGPVERLSAPGRPTHATSRW